MVPSGWGLWQTAASRLIEAAVLLQMLSRTESRLRVARASSFSGKTRNLDTYVKSYGL